MTDQSTTVRSTVTLQPRNLGESAPSFVSHAEQPANHHRVSSGLLVACGASLVGIGLFFLGWRAPLLPEDIRYIGTSRADLQRAAPGLTKWLQRVFWVLGGYITSTGLFTIYIARTSLPAGRIGAPLVLGLSGVTSLGSMSLVNVAIDSDFKWPLLGLASLWAAALAAYRAGH